MKLVVGLGNPGSRYAATRHNAGWMVIDKIASLLEAKWRTESKFKAEIAEVEVGSERLVLAKPQTYMNLSGEAAQKLTKFYKLDSTDVWAIYDDMDVQFGRLRLRRGGGSAGHNGVKSLIAHLGEDFYRARVGIGQNDRQHLASDEYVLAPFLPEQRAHLDLLIPAAATRVLAQIELPTPEEVTVNLI